MLPNDGATGFLELEAVSIDSFQNIPPEIAQREDSVFLLSFAIVRSSSSMLSSRVN